MKIFATNKQMTKDSNFYSIFLKWPLVTNKNLTQSTRKLNIKLYFFSINVYLKIIKNLILGFISNRTYFNKKK